MELDKLADFIKNSQFMLSKAQNAYSKITQLKTEIETITGELSILHSNTSKTWNKTTVEKPNVNDLILTIGPGKNGEYEFSMLPYKGDTSTLLTKWIKLPGIED